MRHRGREFWHASQADSDGAFSRMRITSPLQDADPAEGRIYAELVF